MKVNCLLAVYWQVFGYQLSSEMDPITAGVASCILQSVRLSICPDAQGTPKKWPTVTWTLKKPSLQGLPCKAPGWEIFCNLSSEVGAGCCLLSSRSFPFHASTTQPAELVKPAWKESSVAFWHRRAVHRLKSWRKRFADNFYEELLKTKRQNVNIVTWGWLPTRMHNF